MNQEDKDAIAKAFVEGIEALEMRQPCRAPYSNRAAKGTVEWFKGMAWTSGWNAEFIRRQPGR